MPWAKLALALVLKGPIGRWALIGKDGGKWIMIAPPEPATKQAKQKPDEASPRWHSVS